MHRVAGFQSLPALWINLRKLTEEKTTEEKNIDTTAAVA
jgi:hypothetical protein